MTSFSFGTDSNDLFETILTLKNTKECESFFRDLCTLSELRALTERWQIVLKLKEGLSYRRIAEEVGASTATVTRVSHWLQNGSHGYEMAYGRVTKK